jgi:hypothetical protein
MGWTGIPDFKGDPKDEVLNELKGQDLETMILESANRGKEYYAALKIKSKNEIIGVVILTEFKHGELLIKVMDESMGPYYFNCPKNVLQVLTPTKHESAKEWRSKCYARLGMNPNQAQDTFTQENLF